MMKERFIRGVLLSSLYLTGCKHQDGDEFSHFKTRYELNNYTFAVKDSEGERVGPRLNVFSDDEDVVFQSKDGIHLQLVEKNNQILAAEIISIDAKGLGRYEFVLEGDIDQIPAEVIVSPFLYADDENEVDIEFSSWNEEDNADESPWLKEGNYQFVVQPYYKRGNSNRPTEKLDLNRGEKGGMTRYRIDNFADKVRIEIYDMGNSNHKPLATWEYPHGVAKGDEMRFRLNIYLRDEEAIQSKGLSEPISIILRDFKFTKLKDL